MSKIDIYHGSDHIIEQPVFGKGKPFNDYGLGFYCTEHIELAKEWACSADSDGYLPNTRPAMRRPAPSTVRYPQSLWQKTRYTC
jgi:hypothetical protein